MHSALNLDCGDCLLSFPNTGKKKNPHNPSLKAGLTECTQYTEQVLEKKKPLFKQEYILHEICYLSTTDHTHCQETTSLYCENEIQYSVTFSTRTQDLLIHVPLNFIG